MYKIGDVVVYSVSGVCKVEDICKKDFGSFSAEYYILRPIMQSASTVFVPTQNEKLTAKIHPVLSKESFDKVFALSKTAEFIRPDSEAERREAFLEILESGNREDLILMIFDLKKLSQEQAEKGRRLHLADERLLGSAQTLLFEEVSYVYDIDKDLAEEFIMLKLT